MNGDQIRDLDGRILQLKHQGMRGVDIAETLGIPDHRVYNAVKRNGERYHAEPGSPEIQGGGMVINLRAKRKEAALMEACRELAHEIVVYVARCERKTDLGPDEDKIAHMIRGAL